MKQLYHVYSGMPAYEQVSN